LQGETIDQKGLILISAALARLEGAYSENTLRGYRADFAAFEA
jgi:hypothetical protein